MTAQAPVLQSWFLPLVITLVVPRDIVPDLVRQHTFTLDACMTPRQVKISFRRKPNFREGTVKAFCTVRVPGRRNPKQLHLGYLPSGKELPPAPPPKIEAALRRHWRQCFGHEDVAIDWNDAREKWTGSVERKRARIDRSEAIAQLNYWRAQDGEFITEHFGGPRKPTEALSDEPPENQEATAKSFNEGLRRTLAVLISRLPKAMRYDVEDWWYYEEIPRLLYGFYRYTQRHPGHPFSKQAFLGYLNGNLRRGYAANQYLRQRNRQSRELSQGSLQNIPSSENLSED
jgi:hypothetical protein